MHSRVYAFSKDPDNEFDMPDYFYPTYCDYFDRVDEEDMSTDIEWLIETLQRHNVKFDLEENKITLHNVDGYFDDAYQGFRCAVEMLDKISRSEFQDKHCCTAEYEIRKALSNEDGFWFMLYDGCPDTMQHFMRDVELDVPYYITAIYDYHF